MCYCIYISLEHRPASGYTPHRVYICCVCVCSIIMSISLVSVAEL